MNKYDYWRLLRLLKTEYDKQYTGYYEPSYTGFADSFDKYIQEQYGIKMFIYDDGNIDGTFEITDEGKYAWCLLKHK
jgi:hypothetical protein